VASPVNAGLIGLPHMLAPQLQKTPFAAPALPPFAHCRSCPQYPADDVPSHNHFRPHRSTLNAARLVELREVNRDVNRSICSDANEEDIASERCVLSPKMGDCNDYAVTKRRSSFGPRHPTVRCESRRLQCLPFGRPSARLRRKKVQA
jgi:predicted transglutaminase-like cysteine proteinase